MSPTPRIPLSPQPWPLATVPSLSTPVHIASKVTEARSIAVHSPFRLLPIGGQKGSSPPTVSDPNRSNRGNCCRHEAKLKVGNRVVYGKTQSYND